MISQCLRGREAIRNNKSQITFAEFRPFSKTVFITNEIRNEECYKTRSIAYSQ